LAFSNDAGQPDPAILDGGFDGMLVLRNDRANRLLRHFGFDLDRELSPKEFQAFQAFHFRDVSQR
jgi:hypothetical protein